MPSLKVIDGSSLRTLGLAEYLWVENGALRSKVRAIPVGENTDGPVPILEAWNTHDDQGQPVLLSPCHYLPDPLRPQPSYLVLCEVRDLRDVSLPTNTRSALRFLERQEVFLGVVGLPSAVPPGRPARQSLPGCRAPLRGLPRCRADDPQRQLEHGPVGFQGRPPPVVSEKTLAGAKFNRTTFRRRLGPLPKINEILGKG